MHGQIDPFLEQGIFDFLRKEPFPANGCQGSIEDLVSPGLDDVQFDLDVRVALFQGPGDKPRLPEGESTPSGSYDQARGIQDSSPKSSSSERSSSLNILCAA